MAGTVDDSSASADDWLLLCDFVALITEYCGKSEIAAKQLILDFYAESGRPFAYRYQSVGKALDMSGRPIQGIDPRHWRSSAESERWGIHVDVDWKNNWVTWIRTEPADVKPELLLEVLKHLHKYLPVDPVYQIRLVRLPRRDAFAILRWAGLPQPRPKPSPPPEPQQPPPESESEPKPASTISAELTPEQFAALTPEQLATIPAKTWLSGAMIKWPQRKDQKNSAYARHLNNKHAPPGRWKDKTLENLLPRRPK
jgi:hypothetical protein